MVWECNSLWSLFRRSPQFDDRARDSRIRCGAVGAGVVLQGCAGRRPSPGHRAGPSGGRAPVLGALGVKFPLSRSLICDHCLRLGARTSPHAGHGPVVRKLGRRKTGLLAFVASLSLRSSARCDTGRGAGVSWRAGCSALIRARQRPSSADPCLQSMFRRSCWNFSCITKLAPGPCTNSLE